MAADLIPVGRVVALHGVAGKIKVNLFSGDPSGTAGARTVRLSAPGAVGEPRRERTFEVITAQRVRGCAVFHLRGIESAEEARGWVGAEASVSREELSPPGKDEYYVVDLVGCGLVGPEGEPLGTVTDVIPGPAHDWLAVRRPGGGEAYLPMVGEFVREVDVRGRSIRVTPPEGWGDAV